MPKAPDAGLDAYPSTAQTAEESSRSPRHDLSVGAGLHMPPKFQQMGCVPSFSVENTPQDGPPET